MIPELELDEAWYIDSYPEVARALSSGKFASAKEHFLSVGQAADYDPSPVFSTSTYKRTSKWGERRHLENIIEDYVAFSGIQQASISWMFDEEKFQRDNPKIYDAISKRNLISAFIYYCRNERWLESVRPNAIFNSKYYRDIAKLSLEESSLLHFLRHGQKAELAPSALFDVEYYKSAYPGVVNAAREYQSLAHYFMAQGIHHGQQSIADFDGEYYMDTYPEIRAAVDSGQVISPFHHFLSYGLAEGRLPNPFFDTAYYFANNPSVAKDMSTGRYLGVFEHFLEVGVKRGFRAHEPLRARSVKDIDAKAIFEKRAAITATALAATQSARFGISNSPKVSLIIPVYNHFNFTMNLLGQLSSMLAAIEGGGEVIVVDNGSTDRTSELDVLAPGIRYLRLPNPVGYTLACNAGAEIARGEILIFLNNDIELVPGAISRAIEVLDDTGIGITGGRIVQLNGNLQEAGGIVWRDGSTLGYGRGENPDSGTFLMQRDVDYVSGCFLAMRRELFGELGSFSADFAPGYYEEVDLCAKCWDAGLRVVFDPQIVLFHYEYASYSVGRPPSASTARIAAKRNVFKQRNPAFIRARSANRSEGVTKVAFERSSKQGRRIVVIEDQEPSPLKGAGFNRSGEIVRGLRERGWSVTVLALYGDITPDPVWSHQGFLEVLSAAQLPNGIAGYLRENGHLFDAVWVCRTHNFGHLAPAVQQWKDANPAGIAIADTEAVASTRIAEWRRINGHELTADALREMVADEVGGASFADKIVAVNDIDATNLDGVICSVAVLGQSFPNTPTPAAFDDRSGFLFVGAVNRASEPNYDSLDWYINVVWPLVRRHLPDAKLTVIANWDASVDVPPFMSAEGVNFLGRVREIGSYFDATRVFVAPTRFAGGIPHKVQNALSLGVPTVCTTLLARQLGLDYSNSPVHFADAMDPQAFADRCVEMHRNRDLWEASRSAAAKYITESCSWGRYLESIESILQH